MGEEPAPGALATVLTGSLYDGTLARTATKKVVIKLLAPVVPTDIFCIGLNYMKVRYIHLPHTLCYNHCSRFNHTVRNTQPLVLCHLDSTLQRYLSCSDMIRRAYGLVVNA